MADAELADTAVNTDPYIESATNGGDMSPVHARRRRPAPGDYFLATASPVAAPWSWTSTFSSRPS